MSHDLGHILTGGIKLAVKLVAKAINGGPVNRRCFFDYEYRR